MTGDVGEARRRRQRAPEWLADRPARWPPRAAGRLALILTALGAGLGLGRLLPERDRRDGRFGDVPAFARATGRTPAAVLACLRRNPTGRFHLYRSRHLPDEGALVNEPQHIVAHVRGIDGGSVTTVLLRPGARLSTLHRTAALACTG